MYLYIMPDFNVHVSVLTETRLTSILYIWYVRMSIQKLTKLFRIIFALECCKRGSDTNSKIQTTDRASYIYYRHNVSCELVYGERNNAVFVSEIDILAFGCKIYANGLFVYSEADSCIV